jgi:hypothetical protein
MDALCSKWEEQEYRGERETDDNAIIISYVSGLLDVVSRRIEKSLIISSIRLMYLISWRIYPF